MSSRDSNGDRRKQQSWLAKQIYLWSWRFGEKFDTCALETLGTLFTWSHNWNVYISERSVHEAQKIGKWRSQWHDSTSNITHSHCFNLWFSKIPFRTIQKETNYFVVELIKKTRFSEKFFREIVSENAYKIAIIRIHLVILQNFYSSLHICSGYSSNGNKLLNHITRWLTCAPFKQWKWNFDKEKFL